MSDSPLLGTPSRERLWSAFLKFLLNDFLGVIVGIGAYKPLYELFISTQPLTLGMKIWLGIALVAIFVWLSVKVYERLVDVKYGGATTEQVKQMAEELAELEDGATGLVRENEELKSRSTRTEQEAKRWETRTNRLLLSSEVLAVDLQGLIDRFDQTGRREVPTKEWYCRRFLSRVVHVMERLADTPGQGFRATLMEWMGEDAAKRYMQITYYDCPSTDGNCITCRNGTHFMAGDGTTAGFVLEHGHEVALHNIPEERHLFDDGRHPEFKNIFPYRQLHEDQNYIVSLLCIPIRLRSDRTSETLFVLSIDSNMPFFHGDTWDKPDKFFTLLKPWIKGLVLYTLLLNQHDAIGGKDEQPSA